jgi:hypothetical protein
MSQREQRTVLDRTSRGGGGVKRPGRSVSRTRPNSASPPTPLRAQDPADHYYQHLAPACSEPPKGYPTEPLCARTVRS